MSLRRWLRAGWWDGYSEKGKKDHFRATKCRTISTRKICFAYISVCGGELKGDFYTPVLDVCSEIRVETCMTPVKSHNAELKYCYMGFTLFSNAKGKVLSVSTKT